MEEEKEKKISPWGWRAFVPMFCMLVFAAITLIIYSCVIKERLAMDYVAVIGVACVPVVFPLYTLVFKRPLPVFVQVCICAHMFISANLGTAFDVYDYLPWWDLFAHGLFGFNASVTAACAFRDLKEVRSAAAGLVLAFAVSMALAACWEIAEYVGDRLFGSDTQRVAESVAAGKSPLADTIEDMMITAAGWAAYALFFDIDRACKGRLFRKLNLPCRTQNEPLAPAESEYEGEEK